MMKTIRMFNTAAAYAGINPRQALLNGVKKAGQFLLALVAIWAFLVAMLSMGGCSQAQAAEMTAGQCLVARLDGRLQEPMICAQKATQEQCFACVRAYDYVCKMHAQVCGVEPRAAAQFCATFANMGYCY